MKKEFLPGQIVEIRWSEDLENEIYGWIAGEAQFPAAQDFRPDGIRQTLVSRRLQMLDCLCRLMSIFEKHRVKEIRPLPALRARPSE